jgi:hypothetical protein
MMALSTLHKQVKAWLIFFIVGLLISGLTAFPLEWELSLLNQFITNPTLPVAAVWPALADWLTFIYEGLRETYRQYPFMAYGTDWLAFAHIVIAIAFIGPVRDPVKNIWVLEFGMIACIAVIPMALIAGSIRSIPFFWQLIDCSFGVIGIVPLWLCRNTILKIQRLESVNNRLSMV